MRDIDLFALNVLLEDRESQGALVKMVDSETIQRIKLEKLSNSGASGTGANTSDTYKIEVQRKLEEQKLKAKIPLDQIFKTTGEYSRWDEQGFPTHDSQGEELAKNRRKKIMKEYEAHQKLIAKFAAL